MSRDPQLKQKTLQCLLASKEQPEKVKRSERTVSALCFLGMLSLLIGPIFYFRDLGIEKYIIAVSAASAGMLAMVWQTYSQSIKTMQYLHSYVDFEKLKSTLETNSQSNDRF